MRHHLLVSLLAARCWRCCRVQREGWFSERIMPSWTWRQMIAGRRSTNLESLRGNASIFCPRRFWPSPFPTTSHGSLILSTSGRDREIKFGQIRRWSKLLNHTSEWKLETHTRSWTLAMSLIPRLTPFCCGKAEVEGPLHVCCWVLHVFNICTYLLGNKAIGLFGLDGPSCGISPPPRPVLHVQVKDSVPRCLWFQLLNELIVLHQLLYVADLLVLDQLS